VQLDASVTPRRLAELARYGMGADVAQLKRHGDQRRLATMVATVTQLEATATDDALELLELLMAIELAGRARQEANQETVKRHEPGRRARHRGRGPARCVSARRCRAQHPGPVRFACAGERAAYALAGRAVLGMWPQWMVRSERWTVAVSPAQGCRWPHGIGPRPCHPVRLQERWVAFGVARRGGSAQLALAREMIAGSRKLAVIRKIC
jgi:hypothetical protein